MAGKLVKSLVTRGFTWLEHVMAVCLAASCAFFLGQGLNAISPKIYDYSTELDFVMAVQEATAAGEVTYAEAQEMLQDYRNDRLSYRLETWRMRLTYVVSFVICAVVAVLLFKKYRLFRFRERLQSYFLTDVS
ncbi:MAG: hypothetical protein JSW23_07870 [Planctomycetota bacterium]|nr:MAG: hypothetical protein JSW23_07870 [Planctomycetota bacterium]